MQTLFFCPLWGMEHIPFKDFLVKVKNAGFSGIELPFSAHGEEQTIEHVSQIKKHGLDWIGQHWQTSDVDFKLHKAKYLNQLNAMAVLNPLFINAHTGRDFFTFGQNMELIDTASTLSEHSGIRIIHETHRSRFNYAAHVTASFLKANKNIRITADFSHWCCVAETMLEDQTEAVNLAIQRTEHIHSRVGFGQGPQVPDPRAKEWNKELHAFMAWWDLIIDRAKSEGRTYFTITTEFGPFPYMLIEPHTQAPLADQWEVNIFMKDLLDQRYNQS